jgi:hypothetical protein
MVLRFVDGFDTYQAIGDASQRWATVASGTALVAGRFGGQGARLTASVTMGLVLGAQPTWIVGCAFRHTANANGASFLQVRDTSATVQASLALNSNGTLSLNRQFTVLATSTLVLPSNTWCYVEWKVTVHNTAGSMEARVNGQTWVTVSGVDTATSVNNSADEVWLAQNSNTYDVDDLYVCDATGSRHNDFLGDCRVQTLWPSGVGDASDFVLPGTGYASYPLAVAPDSPVHFWQLQEPSGTSAADTGTGTASALTFTGQSGLRPVVVGPPGGVGVEFSGGAWAVSGTPADLNITDNSTLECWVYVTAFTGTNTYLFSRGAASAWTYGLGFDSTGRPTYVTAANVYAANPSTPLPLGRWFHLAATRSGAVANLYLDGVAVWQTTGMTAGTSTTTQPVLIGNLSAGSVPNVTTPAWPGRIAYLALYNTVLTPERIRAHALWSPAAALADRTSASDPSYAVSSTVNAQSLFALQDVAPASGTVLAVQTQALARKDDAGVRSVASVVKSGASTAVGATVPLSVDYRLATQLLATDPATGAPWTLAAVQALQAGARVVE